MRLIRVHVEARLGPGSRVRIEGAAAAHVTVDDLYVDYVLE